MDKVLSIHAYDDVCAVACEMYSVECVFNFKCYLFLETEMRLVHSCCVETQRTSGFFSTLSPIAHAIMQFNASSVAIFHDIH